MNTDTKPITITINNRDMSNYTEGDITVEWIHNTDIDDIFRIYRGSDTDSAEYQSYPEGMKMSPEDVYNDNVNRSL